MNVPFKYLIFSRPSKRKKRGVFAVLTLLSVIYCTYLLIASDIASSSRTLSQITHGPPRFDFIENQPYCNPPKPTKPSLFYSSSSCHTPNSPLATERDLYISVFAYHPNPICFCYSLVQSYLKLNTKAKLVFLLDEEYLSTEYSEFHQFLANNSISSFYYDFHQIHLGHPVNGRFVVISKFLDEYTSTLPIDRVWLLDSHDVILINDVFPLTSMSALHLIHEGCESTEPFYKYPSGEWLRDTLGFDIYNKLENHVIINAGQIGGAVNAVHKLIDLMIDCFDLSLRGSVWGLDQSCLNYVVYSKRVYCAGIELQPFNMMNSSIGLLGCHGPHRFDYSLEENKLVDEVGCELSMAHHWHDHYSPQCWVLANLGGEAMKCVHL
ncbi:hypothetical protein RCL1_008524 [Eukaryota sp. TZLM3-RCL]